MSGLQGQHFLITGGTPKETIDGVRHYANHARPENHGLEMAKRLVAEGARVALISPKLRGTVTDGIQSILIKPDGEAIVSALDLLETVQDYLGQHNDVTNVLHLANISSLRATQISDQKLKVKQEVGQDVTLQVIGNVNIIQALESIFPSVALMGYNNRQKLIVGIGNGTNQSLIDLINETEIASAQRPVMPPFDRRAITSELAGRKIIITNGPTVEAINSHGDVISNFSSGRQGYAIAEVLADMGAKIILVAGPTHLPTPIHSNIQTKHVLSAQEMHDSVIAALPADGFIGVAAVADFKSAVSVDFEAVEGQSGALLLSQNPDILQAVGQHSTLRPSIVIGFAAETASAEQRLGYALGKLRKKGADAICANQVGTVVAERGSQNNQIDWITEAGVESWEVMGKHAIGQQIGSKLRKLLPPQKDLKAMKLLFVLPPENHPHKTVLEAMAEAARHLNADIEFAEFDTALAGKVSNIHALITDVDIEPDTLRALKKANPHLTLIGLQGCSEETNVGTALDETYASLLRNRCTLMVGLLPTEQDAAARSVLITAERGIKPVVGLEAMAEAFAELLSSRVGNHHYKTNLNIGHFPEAITPDVEEICGWIKDWAGLSLFPKYESRDERYPGAEFGFVAKRTSEGTLITARASNKEQPNLDDLVLISDIDGRTIHVQSLERKASLNAPLAHIILKERPDVNYIVHAHVFLPEGQTTPILSSPGTVEDWQSIEAIVKSGATIINQPQHGTLILLKEPDELLPLLKANGLYQHESALYDTAYARFQSAPDKPTSLERTVQSLQLPPETDVLDLCCGTGASTLALQNLGFTNVDFADGSPSMLAVAEERLSRKGSVVQLENVPAIEKKYDLVTVRQAFAYVRPEDLEQVAENIASLLNPTGRFVFNGFSKIEPGASKPREYEVEKSGMLIRTREDNRVAEQTVLHTQRTEVVDFGTATWNAVLDVNEFYQHDPAQLRSAFAKAGFNLIMRQEGNSLCFVASRNNEPAFATQPKGGAPEA